MADDIRLTRWDLHATAGVTQTLVFTASETLTSLSLYTGGTLTDVDDLTGATQHAGTLSTTTVADDTATVELTVPPQSTGSQPLRLVVNGTVQTVGTLTPSSKGTGSADNTITLAPASVSFDLTILGGVSAATVDAIDDRLTALEAAALTTEAL